MTSRDPAARPPRRALWGTLLLLALLWLGLVAGTAIGARFVPEGSGLAGPAIALGYGVLGALSGVALGAAAIWLAGPGRPLAHRLRTITLVALGLTAASLLLIGWRIATLEADRRAAAGLDRPLPPPAGFELTSTLSNELPTRSYRELTVDAGAWGFEYTAVGPEAARCRGDLTADEAESLVEALRQVELRLERSPAPCAGATVPPTAHYSWRPLYRTAADPGTTAPPGTRSGELAISSSCTRGEPEIGRLQNVLHRLPLAGVSSGRVRCE